MPPGGRGPGSLAPAIMWARAAAEEEVGGIPASSEAADTAWDWETAQSTHVLFILYTKPVFMYLREGRRGRAGDQGDQGDLGELRGILGEVPRPPPASAAICSGPASAAAEIKCIQYFNNIFPR